MDFFHKSCAYDLLIWFFIISFYSSLELDLVVSYSLDPQGPFVKNGVRFSYFCLLEIKAGVSSSYTPR